MSTVSIWNELHRRAQQQKAALHSSGDAYWNNPVNVNRFAKRMRKSADNGVLQQILDMGIEKGASVLDIGAGPGSLAVPLAKSGSFVTAVEPSKPMCCALLSYAADEGVEVFQGGVLPVSSSLGAGICLIQNRFEDTADFGLKPADYVVSSYSFLFDDGESAVLRMDSLALSQVHIFWFMIPTSKALGNEELWPLLHGEPYAGEPTADLLFEMISELGIDAQMSVLEPKQNRVYSSYESLSADYQSRLLAVTDRQKDIIAGYLKERCIETDAGFVVPGCTQAAHIWWKK